MGLNLTNPSSHFKLFLLALGFYTRLPCLPSFEYQIDPKASLFLPVVGWVVGSLSGIVFWLTHFIWSPSIAVMFAIIADLLLTGAFHEDGFADVCDGFGGGYDKQHILLIMKDPSTGVYGALGLMLLLGLKISALSGMPIDKIPLIILVTHSLSRLMPILIMHKYSYARTDNSKSSIAIFKPNTQELLLASSLAVCPLVLLPMIHWLIIVPVVVANALLGRYFFRQIGGFTGDCLGASQQLAETLIYLTCSALWTFI